MKKIILGLSTSILVVSAAQAKSFCRNIFFDQQSAAVRALVGEDGWTEWIKWEQLENFAPFKKSTAPISVSVTSTKFNEVEIEKAAHNSRDLNDFFIKDSKVIYPKHPYNQVDSAPFFYRENLPASNNITAFYTASRSLAIEIGQGGYTLKMPTDRPHGPDGEWQLAKAHTKDDIDSGLHRTNYVDRIDDEIGYDPELMLAREVLTVADKESGDGYLIRDVSFMKDGHYYLPALSIPYIGRKIAELNKQSAEEFWGKNYAELLGRAKAKLLLRYGLQMETPNMQNMLIQLDRELKPTGVLVFRDLSDSFLIEPVANAIGEGAYIESDKQIGYNPISRLNPFWLNSAWRLDEAGVDSFTKQTIDQWGELHDRAYAKEIADTLGVSLTTDQKYLRPYGRSESAIIFNIQNYLFSEEGLKKLKDLRATQQLNSAMYKQAS